MVSTNKALIFAYTLNHKINPLKFSNDDRAQVGKEMDKRTGKQCRERYYNHLREGIKKGYWTPEEDELIKRFHAEHGGCWTHIASILEGRTGNAVKNRWQYLIKGINLDALDDNTSIASGRFQAVSSGQESGTSSLNESQQSQQSVNHLKTPFASSSLIGKKAGLAGIPELDDILGVMDKGSYPHTRIHAYTHTLIHSYAHTLIHSYTHTLIHAYTHTLIHFYVKQFDDQAHYSSTPVVNAFTASHIERNERNERNESQVHESTNPTTIPTPRPTPRPTTSPSTNKRTIGTTASLYYSHDLHAFHKV